MTHYIKKPIQVEAFQFTGQQPGTMPEWFRKTHPLFHMQGEGCVKIEIATLEGTMTANIGDWIIKGVQGEIYPCKDDIFRATYDEVENLPEIQV